jgi:nitroimidazol reductase NimA-like FMN-containing flavoprotein (pyridoxamine 5'-phosphate oxidase superfamily)
MSSKADTVRRKDRQETDSSFLHLLLENSTSCTVAASTTDHPFIHATFFVYDKEHDEINFHFSKYGFGGEVIQNDTKVSISVYQSGKFYTAAKAVDFGCEYQSVIIYGKIRIVEDDTERMSAMKMFFDKFFKHIPKSAYNDVALTEINPVYVVKVKIEKWFGKQHRVPDTALSAFYPDVKPAL